MAVSASAINEQTRRLLRLPFAPTKEEDETGWKKEFTRIIKARCDNDAHAIAVVNRLLETSHRCPEPAAVVEACQEVVPPEAIKAPAGCDLCMDGFQQFQRPDPYWKKQGVEVMVDVVDYCVCTKGQWLKAKHDEYRAREAARKK